MNSHEKFVKGIVAKLEQQAKVHPQQQALVDQVMHTVQQRTLQRRQTWALGGFALAAALTAISFAPDLFSHSQPNPSQVNTVKLSPQLVEDLEMLSLLGAEHSNYGS